MNQPAERPNIRVGLHVYFYFGVAIVILNLTTIFIALPLINDMDSITMLAAAAAICAALNCLIWLGCRRCSTPALSGWHGLLLITRYMTIGIGPFSLVTAVPAAIAALSLAILFAIAGLLLGKPALAPRAFHRLVMLSYRHRMFQ
jgi:hypothetical protein